MSTKTAPAGLTLAFLLFASSALPAGLPDGIELSGKWQPVIWGTPEDPKPGRLPNQNPATLAELPSDIILNGARPVRFTHWMWGDCRLYFQLKGPAKVKLLGEVDVTRPVDDVWAVHEVEFRAPRWAGARLAAPAKLIVNGEEVRIPPMAPASAERINERGEQFGALWLELGDGREAVIRDLWVAPLVPGRDTPAIPWMEMFDANSLAGWEVNGGEAVYRRENGEIIGTTKVGTPNTFLVTERDYRNFEFSVEVHGDVAFNAGIQFRSSGQGGRGRQNRAVGYQCEIDPSERAWSAGIYDEARRGWLHPLNYLPHRRVQLEKGKWHEFRIYADGPVIKTYLNGKLISHIFDAMTLEGYFGLQVHSTKELQPREIRWRNVRIRVLD